MNYFLAFLLAFTASAIQSNVAQAQSGDDSYTRVYLSYEVDGLDLWELPTTATQSDIDAKIAEFQTRCATDVPAFYLKRISSLELNADDFNINTIKYAYRIRGYGDSHRCRMNASIKKRSNYRFNTVNTMSYFDIAANPDTNTVAQTALQQCTAFRDGLDAKKAELKLFDRIIKLVWAQNNGTPYIESCFVTYTTIVDSKK